MRIVPHCSLRRTGSPGRMPEGLTVVNEALARVQQTGCRYYEAELHRIKGELLLTQSVAEEQQAEACFQDALNVARRPERQIAGVARGDELESAVAKAGQEAMKRASC